VPFPFLMPGVTEAREPAARGSDDWELQGVSIRERTVIAGLSQKLWLLLGTLRGKKVFLIISKVCRGQCPGNRRNQFKGSYFDLKESPSSGTSL